MDNPGDFDALAVDAGETYQVNWESSLLEGVNVLEGNGKSGMVKAIPYYAWSNRGIGKMKVWIPYEE